MNTATQIRSEIARMTGFPLAAICENASVTRFAIDRSVVDGKRMQEGLSAMALELAADGVALFHVRPQGGLRHTQGVRLGTWQHYTMRKIA